jgi:hypothetical protein
MDEYTCREYVRFLVLTEASIKMRGFWRVGVVKDYTALYPRRLSSSCRQ